MSRLIDADEFLENNKELADCDFIHPKYCDTLRDLVNNAPTVDVFEQIRAEIERLHYHPKLDFIKNDEVVEMALEIIDKHTKAEMEIEE